MVFNDDDKEIDENIEISLEYECAKLKELRATMYKDVRARYLYYRKISLQLSINKRDE